MTAQAIIQALGGRWHGTYGTARCPAHDDRTPSLKVRDDPNKRDGIDVHCFAGCGWQEVKQELQRQGLLSDLGQNAHPTRRPQPIKSRAQNEDSVRFARDIWATSKPASGTIVETYLAVRTGDETFIETYGRVGPRPFKENLYDPD